MYLGYIRVAAALCIVTLITDIVATLLTGLGLRSKDQRTKYKFYRVAVYVMLLACMYSFELFTRFLLITADYCNWLKFISLAVLSLLIALIVYPVCFAAELNLGKFCTMCLWFVFIFMRQLFFLGNRTVWEFGWAYGVGWGAGIFLFGAVVLLLCNKESEEIYYKERKVTSSA